MKHYVITIEDNPKSVEVAERCITSGAVNSDLNIQRWKATVPGDDLFGMPDRLFKEKYSRLDNCMAAFRSHMSLWEHCVEINQPVTIFEHDAVVTDIIPELFFTGCISFGKPSYGKFNIPPMLGKNTLASKRYFPGAHAYRVNPWGAQQLIKEAAVNPRPTDIFLHLATFRWLEEYYPWPVEARDTFTTIQKTEGCLAKHGYNGSYKII